MPIALTDGTTYAASVTVPVDGDSRNAASVQAPFQNLADRTNYIRSFGAVRAVATEAALEAVTNYAPGQLAAVIAEDEGGLFIWNASSTLDPETALVVRPTAIAGSNPGRWLNVAILGQTVQTGGGSRRFNISPFNFINAVEEWTSGVTGSTVWAGPYAFGGSLTLVTEVAEVISGCDTGEILVISADFNVVWTPDGTSDELTLELWGGIGSPSAKLTGMEIGTNVDLASNHAIHLQKKVTVASAGSYHIGLKLKGVGALGTTSFYGNASIITQHIVP